MDQVGSKYCKMDQFELNGRKWSEMQLIGSSGLYLDGSKWINLV